jgi:hypothetical protein
MSVNAKMIPFEAVPGISGGGKLKYDIFDTL